MWPLSRRREKAAGVFPFIGANAATIDQTNHIRRMARARDDHSSVGMADQQRRAVLRRHELAGCDRCRQATTSNGAVAPDAVRQHDMH